jgi:hypothetical protein
MSKIAIANPTVLMNVSICLIAIIVGKKKPIEISEIFLGMIIVMVFRWESFSWS